MALTAGLLVLGAVVLYAGGAVTVRGTTMLGRATGISAFALGGALFGIDVETLAAAITAAGTGRTEIAGGLAIGSVVFLLTAAFGLMLVLSPRPVRAPSATLLAVPALGLMAAALAISDRGVGRMEGALLVVLYAVYVFMAARDAGAVHRSEEDRAERDRDGEPPATGRGPAREEPVPDGPAEEAVRTSGLQAGLVAFAGLVVLYLGAVMLLLGGVRFADQTQLLSGFVGAAVIGALAVLDQAAVGVLRVRRDAPPIALGALFGAVGAVPTGVLGVAALVRPLALDAGVTISFLVMALAYAAVATTLLLRGEAGRGLGAVLLVSYAVWLGTGAAL